jgi:pyruvate/2-oxoglutarate/acetoin dehydrogenase E1 component
VQRICSKEVPIPYPAHLEKAATPQLEDIEAAVRLVAGSGQGNAA